jgi:hypothetical protein
MGHVQRVGIGYTEETRRKARSDGSDEGGGELLSAMISPHVPSGISPA